MDVSDIIVAISSLPAIFTRSLSPNIRHIIFPPFSPHRRFQVEVVVCWVRGADASCFGLRTLDAMCDAFNDNDIEDLLNCCCGRRITVGWSARIEWRDSEDW